MASIQERVATLEAEVQSLRLIIVEMKSSNREKDQRSWRWVRNIATGVLLVLITSMLNLFVWLLQKIGVQ